jgi:hypothetical protein
MIRMSEQYRKAPILGPSPGNTVVFVIFFPEKFNAYTYNIYYGDLSNITLFK